jgi:zinc protease
MRKKLSFVLLFLVCICMISNAQNQKEFKVPYEKYKLSNGLNVLLHIDRSDPIVAVYVAYHVGSAREEKGKTGFAHLFEHLRFNESQDIPQGQWFKKLQTAGASNVNGSTGNDLTNYFEVIPKNALEMALWMESDRMGFLLSKFTQKTFVTQQNVVQNEKRQGDNRPYSQVGFIMDKLMYPENHPYNWQVIGSMEDLANASIQDAINFHNKYYGPSNATLVVSGDFDVAQTKKWIDKYFAEIKSSEEPKPLPPMPVGLDKIRRAYYEDNLANAAQLDISFPTVEDYTKDSYALNFLSRIIAGSKKSPLYKVLVEEKKLTPNVMARQNSGEIAGSFQITVRAFPNVKLGEIEDAIKEAFLKFEKEGFTDKDVERQKAGLEYNFYFSISSVLGKAMRLADYNIYKGSPDYMATDFKNMLAVTKDDVWSVYNKYIKGQNYIITSFVPKGKPELAAPNSELFVIPEESIDKQGTNKKIDGDVKSELIPSKIDRTKEPAKGPDPKANIPKIWTDKTSKGIKVYGIKQNELPLINFSIILKGGMILDDPDKIGVAFLTARMLNEGTKNKTPIELREAIQDLGANINVMGGVESITLNGSCLASKFKETFLLAKEILLEPRWDEKEFAIAKSQVIEDLKRTESQPASIANNVISKLVYGMDNILANQPNGTQSSINKISIDDLKKFYEKNFSPSVAKIMVLGDIPQKKAVQIFNGLSDWRSTDVKIPDVKVTSTIKPGIYFVDIPKAKQSVFNVGHIGLKSSDPDYYKAFVMNYKLGGDFSSILNMILRETKSFTYGARSGFAGSAYSGLFSAATSVQSNATLETAQIIKDEIAKFRQGISVDDLNLVKSTLIKSNAGKFETLQQLSQMLSPVVQYDLPLDYIKLRESIVQNFSVDEQKSLAQKYLQPDKMIYVIVGDKETQFNKLKDLGLGDPILIDKDGKPVNN